MPAREPIPPPPYPPEGRFLYHLLRGLARALVALVATGSFAAIYAILHDCGNVPTDWSLGISVTAAVVIALYDPPD